MTPNPFDLIDRLGQSAYEHNGDRALLESLGLRTRGFMRGWTDIGTVTVEPAETTNPYNCATGPRLAATVKVEVCSMPAQFWRFTITRPRDETEDLPGGGFRAVYEPVEMFVMSTGSGGFSEYWPTAKALAAHMVDVERVAP